MAVFGSFVFDVIIAFTLGLAGGLAAELITNKGDVEWPHSSKKHYFDAGFLANVFLGGMAALAYLFVSETADSYKFVGATVGAGVGGSAILTAIREKIGGILATRIAEGQIQQVEEAGTDLQDFSNELRQLEQDLSTSNRVPQDVLADIEPKIDKLKRHAEKRAAAIKESAKKAKRELQEL